MMGSRRISTRLGENQTMSVDSKGAISVRCREGVVYVTREGGAEASLTEGQKCSLPGVGRLVVQSISPSLVELKLS